MKRTSFIILIFMSIPIFNTNINASDFQNKIMFIDCEGPNNSIDPFFPKYIRNVVIEEFVSSGHFIILDNDEIDELYKAMIGAKRGSVDTVLSTIMHMKSIDFLLRIELTDSPGNKMQFVFRVMDSDFSLLKEVKLASVDKTYFEKPLKEISNELIDFLNDLDEKEIFNSCTLTVTTEPVETKIRFVDSDIKYNHGVQLESGLYQIELSCPGFRTEREWIYLVSGLKKRINTNLIKIDNNEEVRTFQNIKFVYISPGSFEMGSVSGEYDELPVHKVEITTGFWMSICEITQDEWETVMGYNTSRFKHDRNLPVETVSWFDVQNFIEKLNQKGERKFRLPTEAEWEYASRAGRKTEFSFGEEEDSMINFGWYFDNGENKTHPVGLKKPNPWGLYDMHGNVWEWCQDFYDEKYYSNFTDKDPVSNKTGDERVSRGGSFMNIPDHCRSGTRGKNYPKFPFYFLGFRLVRSN